jgi:hypothetical protein
MAHFGVGADSRVTLIVKREAFDLLREQGVLVTAGPSDALGRVDELAMLSRLGKDYFLEAGGRRFSLPKEVVVSWSEPASERAGSTSPPPTASHAPPR